MKYKKWEKLAPKYNTQWVQKYSLGPTRREVLKIVKPLLDSNPNLKILDIGCGTGQIIQELNAQYANLNYLGIDAAQNMINIAKENTKADGIRFALCPIERFETDEKFDVVICTHAFPYFPDKRDVMLKIAHMCNPEATVIICNSSTNNVKDFFTNLLVKTATSKAHYLSIKKMKELFECAGLTLQDISVIREKWYMPTIALFHVKK